jgi:hypothetical protein
MTYTIDQLFLEVSTTINSDYDAQRYINNAIGGRKLETISIQELLHMLKCAATITKRNLKNETTYIDTEEIS